VTATNRVRVGMVAALASFSLMLAAALPSGAFAFSEFYGGGSLCGSNCYIHSAGAHTFVINEGWSETGSPTLACQLFNGSVNEVSHGSGFCGVNYFGGAFVWARVYNQSNKTYVVTAYAET
jgi:hypothetical protein